MPKRSPSPVVLSLLLASTGCRTTPTEPVALPPVAHERTMDAPVDGQQLDYLLHVPRDEAPDDGWPLLLFLHGAGERGDDLSLVAVHGPPRLTDTIPHLARCVLVSPQCPRGSWWRSETLKALVDEVSRTEHVDPARLYVTGLSMGGYGTWSLLARYPDLFAAAVPICGGGDIGPPWVAEDTPFDFDDLRRARHVPIRAFHGGADDVVPVEDSLRLVQALREVEGTVDLTVYPDAGHDSWTRTYADPSLYAWLFAQRRALEPR